MEKSQDQVYLSLQFIVSAFPVAAALSRNLPVGDLISLSRTSAGLRAALHGFETPEPPPPTFDTSTYKPYTRVRRSLHIGQHATTYWQRLKGYAQYVCTSATHKRGDDAKPCRYCSRPICQGCIVKSSFARRASFSSTSEGTFKNRCRSLCVECWDNGVESKSHKFPLLVQSSEITNFGHKNKKRISQEDFCTCTYKDDAWLCIECKDKQNFEATKLDAQRCHAQACIKDRGLAFERRQICRWCDKPTEPKSNTHRQTWNARIFEAQQMAAESRTADLDEYNRRRFAMSRMSRREMRGDQAVQDDSQADMKQFVRNLDIVNYRRYMSINSVPSGDAIYDSKRGFWRYNPTFLKKFQKRCPKLQNLMLNTNLTLATKDGTNLYAQTNHDKSVTWFETAAEAYFVKRDGTSSLLRRSQADEQKAEEIAKQLKLITSNQATTWHIFRSHILSTFAETTDITKTRTYMQEYYDFDAPELEYEAMLYIWAFSSSAKARNSTLTSEERACLIPYASSLTPKKESPSDTAEGDLMLAKALQARLDQELAEALQVQMYQNDLDDYDTGDENEDEAVEELDVDLDEANLDASVVDHEPVTTDDTLEDYDALMMLENSRSRQHENGTQQLSQADEIHRGEDTTKEKGQNVDRDKDESEDEDESWELV